MTINDHAVTSIDHGEPRERTEAAALVVAAIATVLMLQSSRVFLSTMVFVIDQSRRELLAAIVVGAYLAVLLGAALTRLMPLSRVVATVAIGLAGFRIAYQFVDEPGLRFWLAAAATIGWGWLLPPLLASARSSTAFGVALGLGLDLAIRISGGSVDPGWMPSTSDHVVAVTLALLLVGSSLSAGSPRLARSSRGLSPASALPLLAVGPALAFHHLLSGNLGLAQLKVEVSMGGASWLLSLGILFGLAYDRLSASPAAADAFGGSRGQVALALLAAIGGAGAWAFWSGNNDFSALGLLLTGAASTALTISAIRGGAGNGQPNVSRLALCLTIGLLVHAVLLFAYFTFTGLPALVAVAYLLLAAGGLAGARGARQLEDEPSRPSLAGLGAVAALLVVAAVARGGVNDSFEATGPLPTEFTVMTYNIQTGFSRDNDWNLDAIAQAIEAANPDVVLLQEVSRGWLITSDADQAHWLSERLEMQLLWGPSSRDGLWGNAILTRAEIVSTETVAYSSTENLRRGAIKAVLASATGPITVINTHLDNPSEAGAIRTEQLTQLLAFWDGASPAIIGGDFNATPDSDVITTTTAAGLTDLGAALGPDAVTSEHGQRIDYLLTTPDLTPMDVSIPDVTASDHRPVVARLTSSSED